MTRDQFSENVTDTMLRWELKKLAADDKTFDEVRDIALEWESGQLAVKSKSHRQPTCYGATSSTSDNDALTSLRQMVAAQQEQIAALTKGQAELVQALRENCNITESSGQGRREVRENRSCHYCGKVGHLLRECFKRKRDQSQPRRRGYGDTSADQQGNGQARPNSQAGPNM